MDLGDLWELYGLDGHRELRDPPWTPVTQPRLHAEPGERADIFAAIRAGDLVVHHPYDSFATSVERFVKQAVEDPDVLAIKLTVYRTSDESALIPALIRAAERGKQAVAMVELKARFDERRNITWARSLEEAGAHVVHGLPGLKTHAKALLVVRREGDGVRRYVHVGTGNYNAKTAQLYEDFGVFTTDDDDRRRRDGAVQLDHRLRAAAASSARRSCRRRTRATGSSSEIQRDDRGARARRGRAHRDEDELAGRPGAASTRCTRRRARACRSTSTCAASRACARASRACPRTSASSRSCRASSSTRASTASAAATSAST